MSYVLADLITDVRDELGCVSPGELTDDQITSAIDCASKTYSKFQPDLEDIQVTVPTSGILAAPADCVIVFATSYSQRATSAAVVGGGGFLGFGYAGSAIGYGVDNRSVPVNIYDVDKSAMDVWYAEYVSSRSADNYPLEVRLIGANFEFSPAPSTTQADIWLRIGKCHTSVTFPDRHLEILKDGATWRAGRILALRRHKFTKINFGGQTMDLRDPTGLLKYFDDQWKRWKMSLGMFRHVQMIG